MGGGSGKGTAEARKARAAGGSSAASSLSVMGIAEMRDALISLLLPGEAVVQALRRLGARPKERGRGRRQGRVVERPHGFRSVVFLWRGVVERGCCYCGGLVSFNGLLRSPSPSVEAGIADSLILFSCSPRTTAILFVADPTWVSFSFPQAFVFNLILLFLLRLLLALSPIVL